MKIDYSSAHNAQDQRISELEENTGKCNSILETVIDRLVVCEKSMGSVSADTIGIESKMRTLEDEVRVLREKEAMRHGDRKRLETSLHRHIQESLASNSREMDSIRSRFLERVEMLSTEVDGVKLRLTKIVGMLKEGYLTEEAGEIGTSAGRLPS
uniref:Uncharacterized protein n=1 Tax=Lotharella oceanica TaxID=641309 RepID=A0A7S2X7P1_9EUKA|mmetsp:Transcript_11285/g.21656  ORF Transcript_11285/g.21656 Transcript_11285/m.21656 type:complete len:155 (+) Transcript_11285:148-612(+)